MPADGRGVAAVEDAHVLLPPQVADRLLPRDAHVGPGRGHLDRPLAAVEEADGLRAVLEVARPDLERALLPRPGAPASRAGPGPRRSPRRW